MSNSAANRPVIPILTGPTGAGKSAALLPFLEKCPSLEIISADSRQIYKYLDIGTDKPSQELRSKYKFHFIDRVEPGERFTAFDFVRESEMIIAENLAKGRRPLICGGTGLYIKALVEGIVEIPEDDLQVRSRLESDVLEKGPQYLFERLQAIDPIEAEKTHPHNIRRIIRALEIFEVSGKTKSEFMKEGQEALPKYNYEIICLLPPRELLYKQINDRVDKMMEGGLLAEVEDLRDRGLEEKVIAVNVIGYNELFDYLNDRISLAGAVNLIKQNSRRFAKRQITWFRGMEELKFAESGQMAENYLNDLLNGEIKS
ncbi:tRNA dimethylallyltransferase [Candidatus Zixiibacteriota bacterium]|nr:tRNA dimethylallyltransferase [candidate division Zixibacteria bacterium]